MSTKLNFFIICKLIGTFALEELQNGIACIFQETYSKASAQLELWPCECEWRQWLFVCCSIWRMIYFVTTALYWVKWPLSCFLAAWLDLTMALCYPVCQLNTGHVVFCFPKCGECDFGREWSGLFCRKWHMPYCAVFKVSTRWKSTYFCGIGLCYLVIVLATSNSFWLLSGMWRPLVPFCSVSNR